MNKGKEAQTGKNIELGWSATILCTLVVPERFRTFLVLQLNSRDKI